MGWLQYTDDEVRHFHPAFESVGIQVLADLGVDPTYVWQHHPSSIGSGTVPDFALVDRHTGEWLLIVEMKRTVSAVFSARFQSQAKGYADVNQTRFRHGFPVYFAISNLEVSVLCALNGTRPPTECVVDAGILRSGTFGLTSSSAHQATFRRDLGAIVSRVVRTRSETFDVVWPPIITSWIRHADSLATTTPPGPPPPATNAWAEVNSYFGQPDPIAAARVTLLQVLLAGYMRGRLLAAQHPRATTVPPPVDRGQVARAVDALRAIDFAAIFDPGASSRLRSANSPTRRAIEDYIAWLSALRPDVTALAQTRHDYEELLEQALLAAYPPEQRSGAGKVQTDPELAAVLASLSIESPGNVIDPCCGEGPLLVAALDRLLELGVDRADAVTHATGIEVDPILLRIAASRIALRFMSSLSPTAQPSLVHGDMFACAAELHRSDVVLMNPPFRRYEDQGTPPVPEPVLRHYVAAIRSTSGRPPTSLGGQPNLFHYYAEYVIGAVKPGTTVGFILDNKWFHNRTSASLREFILSTCRVLALVEYPHRYFFSSWDIATSLLIVQKKSGTVDPDHYVKFVRVGADPRQVDLAVLADAMHRDGPWPADWKVNRVQQNALDPAKGWKKHFASAFPHDLGQMALTPLVDLFRRSRRGSLEKEGGGTHAFSMPFSRTNFGSRVGPSQRGGFHTEKLRDLTEAENRILVDAAASVPARFRGRGLKNSDNIDAFVLSVRDVERNEVLEPPALRATPDAFRRSSRSDWTDAHRAAVRELWSDPLSRVYVDAVERVMGLTAQVLPDERRFVDLREPYAGELIIPRKMRIAHRVHINPFALDGRERQVRISSNFVTYGECLALDAAAGLSRAEAVMVIAAFLVSSFGQLQFEEEGVNREGMLAIEKASMDQLLVLDPRSIAAPRREAIIREFKRLPFPVRTDVLSANQPRAELDRLIAEELAPRAGKRADELLLAVHDAVDEWITARQP